MASTTQTLQPPFAALFYRSCRLLVGCVVVSLFALVVLQALAVEAFHVPSGSMAPALLGHHRVCVCPRCGHEVVVGRHTADAKGAGEPRFYRKAFCPNCGHSPLPVADTAEIAGDQISVDKTAFLRRAPSRWEIVVFRLLGSLYIKRLLGLPGEEIRIRGGDVYANGRLCRKTLEQARQMRLLVFEQEKAPKSDGWKDRWEHRPAAPSTHPNSAFIALDAGATLTYRNVLLGECKCEPLRDEYAYNAGTHANAECVHDFLVDTEIEILSGSGSLGLRLCDGQDWVEVVVPVGAMGRVEAFAWPVDDSGKMRKLAESSPYLAWQTGERHRVELALVDRRVSFAIDGKVRLVVDLPHPRKRAGVTRPFAVSSDGVAGRLHRFRLYRDVHYGQQGRNAVAGKAVRLGVDQYFMLGDNSANSEDSRYWRDGGRIASSDLIGPINHPTRRDR